MNACSAPFVSYQDCHLNACSCGSLTWQVDGVYLVEEVGNDDPSFSYSFSAPGPSSRVLSYSYTRARS